MPFAVELYFDAGADVAVRAVWQQLADAGITATMPESGSRSHVSLAVYEEVDASRRESTVSACARETPSFDFVLASLGIFPTSEGVVFLAPVVTAELLHLHETVQRRFAEAARSPWPYYLPGSWVPHCTLAIGLPPHLIPSAVALCQQVELPIRGRYAQIGVVEFPPVRDLTAAELRR